MEKKNILILGMIALLIIGTVLAINSQKQKGGSRFSKVREKLGLPENANRGEIREAIWQKKIKELGLTEESTLKEFRESVEKKKEMMHEERLATIKEKLGLKGDTTEAEVREALKNWRKENRNLIGGLGKRRSMMGRIFRR